MTLILDPPGGARERILAFGGSGTGKTHDWLTIADAYAKAKREGVDLGTFYVVDSDFTVERSMQAYPGVEEVVVFETTPEWSDYVGTIEKFNRLVKRNDWLVVDMASPLWEMAQEHYIERIFKKDMDEFYLAVRETNKKGGAMDGFKDWSVINKLYKQNVSNHLMRCQGHLYATAAATPLSGDLDSKEMKAIYARFGVKPVGQKHLSHMFHSVLWKQAPKTDQWTLTTIKDRARVSLLSEPMTSFVDDYLVGVAGWKTQDTQSPEEKAQEAAEKAARVAAVKAAAMERMAATRAAAEAAEVLDEQAAAAAVS